MTCCGPRVAVLDPVLGKSTVKRGKAVIMKIGDAEVEVDPKFRLYLQVSTSEATSADRLKLTAQ